MQLSIIPISYSPAFDFYHRANEIPVSNNKVIQLNRF